ncbi:HNH endonuclease signature motif containing protein [Brachybacterium vulturis]|uniref:HNH endonuclease signature motif containing protein n=1 Tax=Brachybacterium vulturis TaxID=2017484 RepID=UPI003735C3F8
MSAIEEQSSPFDEGGRDEAVEAAFLASLPPRLRNVSARQELTRSSLPLRGRSMDDPQLSAVTQRVWDAEKQEARCLAEKHRALAELYEHDGQYEETAEVEAVDAARAGLALRVTTGAAGWHLRDAYQAVHLFPRCLAALESGVLPSTWFQKMLKSSRSLMDDSRKNLDIAVASWSPDISPERFFTLLKKLITLLEQREERPDPLDGLARSVELLPSVEPGMGTMQISGPIPDILAQWKLLDESARAVQTAQRTALREGTSIPHDPDGLVLASGRARSLTELRFALMSSATLDVDGVSVPAERFRLNVTVPALTLLGASDEPGSLEGTVPLPPSMARSLAGSAGAWYRVLTDPSSGAFLPLPAQRYQPSTAMLEHLRLRHSMCAVPGCTRPTSWASECDHIQECRRGMPDAGALTEIENLHLLCWQHHLDKTAGLLDPTRLPTAVTEPGRTRWVVGHDGDVVTVSDDLDTASLQIAEDLARAWTCFLRGTPAGEPVTEPVPAAPAPADPAPPGPGGPARVLPPEHPKESTEDSFPEYFAGEPPLLRPGHHPPPQEPESPPEPWEDLGPPPF